MTAQILLSLSILVGLHEMGHLLAAKYFGMRVEQFSIGFPPKVFGFKYGETEYNLSAIPLGGFVKISGMIDESLDVEKMKEEPKPYEFRAKPAWQRLIVMLGGIIVNVITGVIIFIILTWSYGDSYIPKDEVNKNGGIYALELAKEIGLQTGDKIVKINGQEFDNFDQIVNPNVLLSDNPTYTVERNGELIEVEIPTDFIETLSQDDAASRFVLPRLSSTIGEVAPNTLADRIGLKPGDKIVEINGQEVAFHDQVSEIIKSYNKDSIGLVINRDGKLLSFEELFKNDTIIGYHAMLPDINMATIEYDLGRSISLGTERAFGIVFLQLKAFGKIFSGELSVTKSLSGPIGIAKAYGGDWNWQRFWSLTGMLSMVLAFMNLLPIPALDGGHVMFLSYEMISGRKPSDKFLENAQKIGMIFLLGLMVFIIFNDIFKLEFIKNIFGIG